MITVILSHNALKILKGSFYVLQPWWQVLMKLEGVLGAGPVVAAAVILPEDYFLAGLTDSKKDDTKA